MISRSLVKRGGRYCLASIAAFEWLRGNAPPTVTEGPPPSTPGDTDLCSNTPRHAFRLFYFVVFYFILFLVVFSDCVFLFSAACLGQVSLKKRFTVSKGFSWVNKVQIKK